MTVFFVPEGGDFTQPRAKLFDLPCSHSDPHLIETHKRRQLITNKTNEALPVAALHHACFRAQDSSPISNPVLA